MASDDGHPVAGALVFSVGMVTGAATGAPASDALVQGAVWLARWVMTAGLILGVGGALFGAVTPLTRLALPPISAAAQAGLLAAPLYLGLHGLDALGLGFSGLLTLAPWVAAWGTSFGPSVALAMLAAVLALLGLRIPVLAWGALALLAIAYAASGHAGAAAPRWLTRPMVSVHLVALCFWIGALVPLAMSLRHGAGGLARFSRLIPMAVILLMVSGTVLGVVQLGMDPQQWLSPYGYILAAKLTLLAVLFALAVYNRHVLTAPTLARDIAAGARLRRSIMAELVLAVAILGLTAGWRFTPPPRALAEAGPALSVPAYGHLHSDTVMADLIITPGTAGPVRAELYVTDADMHPFDPFAMTLALSLPERGVERLIRPATPVDGQPGSWVIEGLVLPLAGKWTIDLEVRRTRFNLVKLGADIVIK